MWPETNVNPVVFSKGRRIINTIGCLPRLTALRRESKDLDHDSSQNLRPRSASLSPPSPLRMTPEPDTQRLAVHVFLAPTRPLVLKFSGNTQREADLVRDRFAGRDLNDGEEVGGDNPSVKLAAAYMAASKPSAIAAEAKREQVAEDAKRKEDEALESHSKPKLASHMAAATVAVVATTTSKQASSAPKEASAAAMGGNGGSSKGGVAHASDAQAIAEDKAKQKHKQTQALSAKKLALHAATVGKAAGGRVSKAKPLVAKEAVEAAGAPEEAKAHAVASAAKGPKASSGAVAAAAAAAKEPAAKAVKGGSGGGETNEKLDNVLQRIDRLIRGYTKGASSHPDFLKHFQSGSSLPKLQGGDGRSTQGGGGVLYMPNRPPPGQDKS